MLTGIINPIKELVIGAAAIMLGWLMIVLLRVIPRASETDSAMGEFDHGCGGYYEEMLFLMTFDSHDEFLRFRCICRRN